MNLIFVIVSFCGYYFQGNKSFIDLCLCILFPEQSILLQMETTFLWLYKYKNFKQYWLTD